jgi:hypothetical protein
MLLRKVHKEEDLSTNFKNCTVSAVCKTVEQVKCGNN